MQPPLGPCYLPVVPRVLIVDDDPLVLRIERVALTRAGFEVSAATSISEAYEELGRVGEAPVIALVDLFLGTESGLDLVRGLKARGFVGPVIGVSGDARSEEALAAGADGFLPKPFSPAQIVACVQSALSK